MDILYSIHIECKKVLGPGCSDCKYHGFVHECLIEPFNFNVWRPFTWFNKNGKMTALFPKDYFVVLERYEKLNSG